MRRRLFFWFVSSCFAAGQTTKDDGLPDGSRVLIFIQMISQILREYRRIAVVGLSPTPYRPSHFVAAYLAQHGYEITPVNPMESEILGRKCYPSLRDVPRPLEIVDIFRDASAIPGIVEEAIECGAKVIWMQSGLVHEAAARQAREAGLQVVMDRCIMVEHEKLAG
jgi:predicted CoA-binding protein